jgi:Flp pilus assembly protein TadG
MGPLSQSRARPAGRTRRGTAAVEAALALPLVIALTLGCIDFARALHTQICLQNIARVGAEYGATHSRATTEADVWEATLRQAMLAEAAHIPRFSADKLTITTTVAGDSRFDTWITVSVGYPLRTAVHWPGVPHNLTLAHEVTMRQYR